ncbi:inositol polyphosphate 5-phosphatase [Puccinia graminis f. sp. tritici]|uniref:Inositol polyphosphate 5-phosphatase n=1 Tax=Puccinia graminis f. sp. tritici TaxID=56615 RepID=A0A5B0MAL0_PUCGR|nr:inositol polyphosphate 5-phosphatase [Puccinia graminis f. sp. tritici]
MVDRVKKEVIKQEILESSELGSLRDALMMPLQAGTSVFLVHIPSSLVTDPDHGLYPLQVTLPVSRLQSWMNGGRLRHPNGTCELNPPEQAQGIGGSSNPFIPNIGPPRPGRQCSTPEANPVGSNRLFNGKLDRQISSSVPSSPPPQVGKGIPPAIPARPASRSPSETRKPVTEKSGSTLKAQPPPPPPRPTSKLIVSKDNTLVEIIPKGPPRPPPTTSGSLLTSQISPTSTETFNSRARSLSGRKSAPSGLQLGVPPPPSHPALKLPHRQESVKSPLLSASTSKLISGKQVTPIRPGYTTPPPPPRPASRGFANTADAPIGVENPQFSPRSTLKLPQRRETTPAELDSNNPPLPPRPVSRLLNSEDPPVVSGVEPKRFVSLNVLAGKGIDSAELDRKNPTPPPRPASRIVFGKELATNGGGIGTEGPSLPARPVSTLLTAGNPSIRLEVKGSSPLPGPSSVLDTGVYTSSPSPPPRSAGQLTTTHRPPPPSRKASKLSLNNEAPPEPPQPATPLRPALKASPSKDNCLVDLDDQDSAVLPVTSIVTPPPPIPPKPKPPKPALKPKPLVLRKSASHESRSLRPADPPNSCQ